MSSFSEYLESGYTPGEVYRSSTKAYRKQPQAVSDYLEESKYEFAPDANPSLFERFLALQNNPDYLAQRILGSSKGFNQIANMFNVQE